MLRSLHLKNVGPSTDLRLDPVADRFNLITGDNGLGKSFLLEIEPADGALGSHVAAAQRCGEDFENLTPAIAEKTGLDVGGR